MSRAWYSFQGGSVNLPESYSYSPLKPTCTAGRNLCSIYAIYAGQNPAVISSNLQSYIASGQSTGLAQPSAIGAKKFVYLLP